MGQEIYILVWIWFQITWLLLGLRPATYPSLDLPKFSKNKMKHSFFFFFSISIWDHLYYQETKIEPFIQFFFKAMEIL